MSWASGSGLMEDIIFNLKLEVEDYDTRVRIYKVLITSFEEYDCDTSKDVCNSNGITGYPSLILFKNDGSKVNYPSTQPRVYELIVNFVKTNL